ncbi:MAG: hypothetical protein JWQ97_4016, partial [Phenylobacterium sp.]|nr:hypothetical protein [Phenylobacterium sp.]
MILTCPECATSYFVDDTRIPPQGRRVKCSSCAHRWTAGPDGPIAEDPPALAPQPERFAEAPHTVAPEDDLEVMPAEPASATVRRAALAARAGHDNRSSAMIWAGAAALAAALIAGVIVFREQVVRFWPASSAAYAGLGLAVDGGGLVLEQVRVEPAFLAGRPVLSVTGAIRNVRDEAVNTPPIRVTLLNRAGKPVAAKIARPMDASIPPRAKRHFAIAILDPPSSARDLEVRFDSAADGKAPPRAAEAV